MKTAEELKETLSKHKKELKDRFKVKEIGLFGSYVRGEQKKSSDVDVLVKFSEPVGWDFFDLKERLEELLETKVDLVTVPALKAQMKDRILKEVLYA